ncbi:MAG: hypothetical protein ACJ71F_05365 [Nitrososphaeraceae archaeon]|jgi:hypothetical protein
MAYKSRIVLVVEGVAGGGAKRRQFYEEGEGDVSAHVIYKNTGELYELVERIKTMDYVVGIQWSEMVDLL